MTEFHLHKHETLPTQMRSFLQGMRGSTIDLSDVKCKVVSGIASIKDGDKCTMGVKGAAIVEAMPDTTLHFTSERSIVED
jgi:hypothetical protein